MIRQIALLVSLFVLSFKVNAQGIEFFHGTWEEALELAQKQNKLIFIDCYTTWCGPCKRMSSQVFTQKEVGDFYNEKFINYKLDMEQPAGRKFGQEYPVSAYPTFYWIDGDGAVVLTTKGAKQPADFIALGESALKEYDGSAKYKIMYDAGDHSYEVVYGYVTELSKAGKSPVRIANEYLGQQQDITTPDNLAIVLAGAWQVDSKLFETLVENRRAVIKEFGQEIYDETVRKASLNTVQRAMEYDSRELLEDAEKAMKDNLPDEADAFTLRSEMDFALYNKNADDYAAHAADYMKKHIKNDAIELNAVAVEILDNFTTNTKCLDLGVKAAKSAVDIEPKTDYMVAYATLTFINGDKAGALKVLDEAIRKTEPQTRERAGLMQLRKRMAEA